MLQEVILDDSEGIPEAILGTFPEGFLRNRFGNAPKIVFDSVPETGISRPDCHFLAIPDIDAGADGFRDSDALEVIPSAFFGGGGDDDRGDRGA